MQPAPRPRPTQGAGAAVVAASLRAPAVMAAAFELLPGQGKVAAQQNVDQATVLPGLLHLEDAIRKLGHLLPRPRASCGPWRAHPWLSTKLPTGEVRGSLDLRAAVLADAHRHGP